MPDRTFPRDPLLRVMRADGLAPSAHGLSVSGTTWRRWGIQGLSEAEADHYACRLGRHPVEVWGLDWYETDADYRVGRAFALLREAMG
jgi:hypothetical protein